MAAGTGEVRTRSPGSNFGAMAPRPSSHRSIGATQAPDFLSDQLASIELDGLEAQFELEDVRVCSMSLAKADAGSGRFERVYLEGH